jgi:hypothetical protein
LNDQYAVVPVLPVVGTWLITRTCPPAVYPEAETSPTEVYAVVVASSVAALVYNAILNVCVVPVLKLNVPLGSPVLNVLVVKLP